MNRWITATLVLVLAVGSLWLENAYPDPQVFVAVAAHAGAPEEPSRYILDNFVEDTGAENAVAAIYLSYRVYDTLFEALLLLIAIVGIMHFFRVESPRDGEKES
jgi:multisubunit Na+/H+ antiporter MnhB subunit